jgi:hypothetical protein
MNRLDFLNTIITSIIGFCVKSFSFDQEEKINLLLGKGSPDLTNENYKILKAVNLNFVEMKNAANKDGINLKIVSGYRPYQRQKIIWNSKFLINEKLGLTPLENINKIIQYSTIPGTSRHHWGTEIDIIDGNKKIKGDVLITNNYFNKNSFEPMRIWLEENSNKFGFVLPYTKDPIRSGFYYEPWHYSYSKLSKIFLEEYVKLNLVEKIIDSEILGIEYMTKNFMNDYEKKYILGLNKELLPNEYRS